MGTEEKIHTDKTDKEKRPDIPDIYVNSVNFAVSPYDFILQFGLKSEENIEPKHLLNIRMSPQHAKVFAFVFLKTVRTYEQKIGEIKLPKDLMVKLNLDEGM